MTRRYQIAIGSVSAHCCFEASVLDTHTKISEDFDRPEIVCECFEIRHAEMICDLLNANEP